MNRIVALIAFLATALCLGWIITQHSWLLLYSGLHVRTLIAGLLPFVAFVGVGERIVSWLFDEDAMEFIEKQALVSFATLGSIVAIGFLLLTIHLGFPFVFLALSALLLIADLRRWKPRLSEWCEAWKSRVSGGPDMVLVAGGITIWVLVSLIPPLWYDTLSYHLPTVETLLREGRWVAFPHDVYAAFPMNAEMVFLWPMALGSFAGVKVTLVCMGLIALLATMALARRWAISSVGLVALSLVATGLLHRVILQGKMDIILTACAAILLLSYERARESNSRKEWLVMGSALGLALGSKYVSAIAVFLPFLAVVCVDMLVHRRWSNANLLFVVSCLGGLLVAPWLIRNVWFYGNPVYPLLTPLLGGEPPLFAEVFRIAHAPPDASPGTLLLDVVRVAIDKCLVSFDPLRFSPLWLIAVPVFLLVRCTSGMARGMIFAGIAYVAWVVMTQRNDRFLAPILPVMAILPVAAIQCVQAAEWKTLMSWAVRVVLVVQLYAALVVQFSPDAMNFLIRPTLEDEYIAERMPHHRAIVWLNDPPAPYRHPIGTVLFIGEAQTAGARFSYIAPSVFNQHPVDEGIPLSVTHVVVNTHELNRLRAGYGPMGWTLGERLHVWLETNRGERLRPVFDAYPDQPDTIVVYEYVRE